MRIRLTQKGRREREGRKEREKDRRGKQNRKLMASFKSSHPSVLATSHSGDFPLCEQ